MYNISDKKQIIVAFLDKLHLEYCQNYMITN
jgi:hypothetical protein